MGKKKIFLNPQFKTIINNLVLTKSMKLWLKKKRTQHHLLRGFLEFVLKVSGTFLSIKCRNCRAT